MSHITRLATGGPISAQATVADLTGDGQQEIIAVSDGIYAWRADGSLLPGFPVYGRNAFASRPLVVPLDDQGTRAIFVGCDDDSLYAFAASGALLPGYPLQTGGDVYSSPAVGDLDGDGQLELVVGSDDGNVYAWRLDGTPLAGWPRRTEGFVAASPVLVDLVGDGQLEVVTGSWDGRVYAWRGNGDRVPGWPQQTGHFVWSTPRIADLTGDGAMEVIAASDQVYVWAADSQPLAGWPQPVESYIVGDPLLADITGDGTTEIIVGADKLYAWSPAGTAVPGYPVDLGAYSWSSPVAAPDGNDDDGAVVHICGWDGHLKTIHHGEIVRSIALSDQPIFATPTLAALDEDNPPELIVGAWDGNLYRVPPDAQSTSTMAQTLTVYSAASLKSIEEETVPFVRFDAPPASKAIMTYRADFERESHPVPLVVHQDALTGLIQPFPAGARVTFSADVGGQPHPAEGFYRYTVRRAWGKRIRRRLRQWMIQRGFRRLP